MENPASPINYLQKISLPERYVFQITVPSGCTIQLSYAANFNLSAVFKPQNFPDSIVGMNIWQ
jgi:hypothetical protein